MGPVPSTSPSPPPPMLPPALSATPCTDRPHTANPFLQHITPPSNEKSSPMPFLMPPDGANQQKSRLQPPPKAASEGSERRLRTPSPAASTGSVDWLSMPHRNGTSPRKYYNRKRRYLDLNTGEASRTDRDSRAGAGDSGERRSPGLPPPEIPPSRSTPKSSATQLAQTSAVCLEPHLQPVPSATAPQRSRAGTPLLSSRSARAVRYLCRYCRQRFSARILLSLHRVNGACELHRSHNYARGGGGGDRPQVTERELMLAARVRLERLYACPHCLCVLSSKNVLEGHLAAHHSRSNPRDTRASVQTRWQPRMPPLPDAPSQPPVLLPLSGRSSDYKDNVLEALGLTRKT